MQNSNLTNKISSFIIDKKKIFAFLFLVLIVFSIFSMNWIKLEENIVQFLPENAESKVCIDVMDHEFVTYGSGQVVIENINADEADKLANKLQMSEFVESVTFDKATDYKEDTALIGFSLKTVAETEENEEAITELRTIFNNYNYSVYNSSDNNISRVVSEQMKVVMLIVAVIVVAILLITSDSIGEVLVLLLTFITAAIINYGTHFILGTISMISNSVSIVLQLALSIDYAVILCHRYREERKLYDKSNAAKSALKSSFVTIISSSLTTIAGLIAITFMQFRLGYDLGRVLIKSIIISLVTVFVFTPFLLVLFDSFIQKTTHKRFIPKVSFLGKFANATRVVMPIILCFVFVFGAFMTTRNNYAYTEILTPSHNEFENDYAKRITETKFLKNTVALLVPKGNYSAEKELIKKIEAKKNVNEVIGISNIMATEGYTLGDLVTYKDFVDIAGIGETEAKSLFVYYAANNGEHRDIDNLDDYGVSLIEVFTFLHDKCLNTNTGVTLTNEQIDTVNKTYEQLSLAKEQLTSDNYSRIVVNTSFPIQSDETYEFLDYIHTSAKEYYSSGVLISGNSMVNYDFNKSFSTDINIVSLLSILFVFIILMFAFRSPILPVLLIAIIQGSIWINFAIPSLQGNYIFFVCYLIVTAIQMGSNIDYAIVISSRYIELRKTMDKRNSIINALNIAFPTILTTGIIMVISGFLISYRVSENVTAGIGHFVCTGALISLVLVFFVLPQVLLLCDKIIINPAVSEKAAKNGKNGFGRVIPPAFAILCLVIAIALPINQFNIIKNSNKTVDSCNNELKTISELEKLDEKMRDSESENDKLMLDFTKDFLTISIGDKEIEKGQQEYNDNKNLFDKGQKEYVEANKKYLSGKNEYELGMAEYQSGLKEYESGIEEFTAGKIKYDAGVKEYQTALNRYKTGLKEYNNGLNEYNNGQKDYDSAVKEYESAKERLDSLEGLYNFINPYYASYSAQKKEYEKAVAAGDTARAEQIKNQMAVNELLFETNLGEFGSVEQLISEFRAGKLELSRAEKQLKAAKSELEAAEKKLKSSKSELDEGKIQLDAAKKELEGGKAELDLNEEKLKDAKKELNSANKELEDGKAELDSAEEKLNSANKELTDGKNKLENAQQQLDDGHQTLDESKKKLVDYYTKLDVIKNDKEKLTSSIKTYKNDLEISENKDYKYTNLDVLDVAKIYYSSLNKTTNKDAKNSMIYFAFLILAVVAAFISAIMTSIKKSSRSVLIFGIISIISLSLSIILQFVFNLAVTSLLVFSFVLYVVCAVCIHYNRVKA